MLVHLHIRNLALVPELDMDFSPGLNIISGETGAGKSLIIGAVHLLAGDRATPGLIRHGEKSCEVAGAIAFPEEYQVLQQHLDRKLQEEGIPPCEDRQLLLRRVVTETGSRAYVNGAMVTAAFLKEISAELMDLHGPHDNQRLLSSQQQLLLLDTYADLGELQKKARQAYGNLAHLRAEQEKLQKEGLAPEELPLLEFQAREIRDAGIAPGEEELLLQRYRLASSSQDIAEAATAAQQAICGTEESSITDQIAILLRNLRKLEGMDADRGAALVRELETAAENLQEIGNALGEYAENLDLDGQALREMEERLDLLQKLKRKYGPTLEDVLLTEQRINARIARIQGKSQTLQDLKTRQQVEEKTFRDVCEMLTSRRKAIAPKLAEAIREKLRSLGFQKSDFSIQLSPAPSAGPYGMDAVSFLFAPNAGEDYLPLKDVASSGEIARVMLAIKTVLSDADAIPVMIFDEIDANIGGRVAIAVGDELRAVARRHQVFSITHLPQIAAAGNAHYLVAKDVQDDRIRTSMTRLEETARLDELVRMLGASEDSAAAREHAQNLLQHFDTTP